MEPKQKTPLESPAWQKPAPGNERNDSIKNPANETIKPGGNSRSAEDDLDLEKQPYHDKSFAEKKQDFNRDPD
jgi:hypothetical protein